MANPSQQASDIKYLDDGWKPEQCGVAHAGAAAIKVCLGGNGSAVVAQAFTRKAVLAWLEPLRSAHPEIASDVDFTCQSPNMTVNVHGGNLAAMGSPGWVQIGDANDFGAWLHVFGHAFACLGDTYLGDSGTCSGPSPSSVMCYGPSPTKLTASDGVEIRRQYDRATTPTTSPNQDGDGDKVPDRLDHCPNTASGSRVWTGSLSDPWRGCAYGQTPVLF